MKEVRWQTGDGREARVTIELKTKNTVWADGDEVQVDCCEMIIKAEVGGQTVGLGDPIKINHPVAVAKIGQLAMTADNYNKVITAIRKIEETPEWQAKIEREKKALEADREYEAHRAKMKKVMGY